MSFRFWGVYNPGSRFSFCSFIHGWILQIPCISHPKKCPVAEIESPLPGGRLGSLPRSGFSGWGDVAETEILDESVGVPCVKKGWMKLEFWRTFEATRKWAKREFFFWKKGNRKESLPEKWARNSSHHKKVGSVLNLMRLTAELVVMCCFHDVFPERPGKWDMKTWMSRRKLVVAWPISPTYKWVYSLGLWSIDPNFLSGTSIGIVLCRLEYHDLLSLFEFLDGRKGGFRNDDDDADFPKLLDCWVQKTYTESWL